MAFNALLSVIFVAICFIAADGRDISPRQATKGTFTIADIIPSNLSGVYNDIHWITDNDFTYRDENDTVWLAQIDATGKVDATQLEGDSDFQSAYAYYVSPSLRYICIAQLQRKAVKDLHGRERFMTARIEESPSCCNRRDLDCWLVQFSKKVEKNKIVLPQELYRHSTYSKYYVYQLNGHSLTGKTLIGPTGISDPALRIFVWNPNVTSSDFVFEYGNDLYYQLSPAEHPFKITDTGSAVIFNGIPDWVYEEEVLETDRSVWWSPSGDILAYLTLNDTKVPNISMTYYPEYPEIYPQVVNISYPKVNMPIPDPQLSFWNRRSNETVSISPPQEIKSLSEYYYIYRLSWLKSSAKGPESAIVTWTNRVQDMAYFTVCSLTSGTCVISHKQNYTGYWVQPSECAVCPADNGKFFLTLPKQETDGFYQHLAMIDTSAKEQPRFLTSGGWGVAEIVGFSSSLNKVFFMAMKPTPASLLLYSADVTSREITNPKLMIDPSLNCNYSSALFSPGGAHYFLANFGPKLPTTALYATTSNKQMKIIENNAHLAAIVQQKKIPQFIRTTIPLEVGPFEAITKLTLPDNFTESARRKYPVILRVYGGPSTQAVTDGWFLGDDKQVFDAYLATVRGYVIVHIDGRGSSGRGSKYLTPVYRNLGAIEIVDQVNAFRSLLQKYPFLDASRTAVWGWSYGGFATGHIVEYDRFTTLKCAASIAPVTKYVYYDATYAERYMDLYPNNEQGYANTDLMKNVSAFKDHRFLIAHGTYDDNVHFQNTAMLISALTTSNVQFRMMIYQNRQHHLHDDRMHLYTMLDDFFINCFQRNV